MATVGLQPSVMRLGEKLTKWCGLKRLSQRDVAQTVNNVSVSTVNRWLSGEGEPRLSEAVLLARLLEVPIEFLAYDDLDEPPSPELTEDDRAVLDVFHAKRLSRREAMRRLMDDPGDSGPPQHSRPVDFPPPRGRR